MSEAISIDVLLAETDQYEQSRLVARGVGLLYEQARERWDGRKILQSQECCEMDRGKGIRITLEPMPAEMERLLLTVTF
jgi:hypothetical protein